MLDVKIVGGMVIDGTGSDARRADVGIVGDRIVAIGTDLADAVETVDAAGRVVAPGFVDLHTHYDAQVMWDPSITPSSLHGVTTVIGGNCGFTIAPVSPESREYVMQMLACVEGMPIESLRASLDWQWSSFGEWLARLDGTLSLNTGFSVGHSTIRRLVMGPDYQRNATESEVAEMARHVTESLDAGALGFSSSWGEAHADHLGLPVPSRFAARPELIRLASCLQSYPGTTLEFIPTVEAEFSDDVIELMGEMSAAAGRPLNWNAANVGNAKETASIEQRLSASDRAAVLGGRVVALTTPMPSQLRINLLSTIAYNPLAVWPDVLALPIEDRLRALRDRSTRAGMAEAVAATKGTRASLNFAGMIVESVVAPELHSLVGRNVSEIAAERGCTPLEAFLDIAVDDRLRATFAAPALGTDDAAWSQRASLWKDPRTLVGASDAGAHLDMLATFGYFTDFVGPSVRDRGLLTLPQAVRMVTDEPARFYGLRDRGRVAEYWFADLVVFDPNTVGNADVVMREDMPGGGARLYAGATGVDHVLVNGQQVVRDGALTTTRPGTVLRGGRDTE